MKNVGLQMSSGAFISHNKAFPSNAILYLLCTGATSGLAATLVLQPCA
jgi:hypothetical protein